MNQATDAVRYAQSSAFQDTPKLASKGAKRALLRHLADMVRWECQVQAYLDDRKAPECDHSGCRWICFQSEPETADEMSISTSAVKRTRRALVADGWINVTQGSAGRGAVTFYELSQSKLEAVARQRSNKRCKLPPLLRKLVGVQGAKGSSMPPFDEGAASGNDVNKGSEMPPFIPADEADKGSNLHPFSEPSKTEGEHPAPTRGATCPDKGGILPLHIRKNRIEPEENQNSADAPPVETVPPSAREQKLKAAITEAFTLPDWIPEESWNAYVEMRKKIRKPMTLRAAELAVEELEKLRDQGYEAKTILDHAVFNSWQGLWAPKNVTRVSGGVGPNIDDMAETVAKGVQKTAAIFGAGVLAALKPVCLHELDGGVPPEQVQALMVENWQRYMTAKPQLEFHWGAERFFGEGHWKNPAGWPWKRGQAPQQQMRGKSALEKMREGM